ncbi:MAG: hypothetical protein ACYSUI_14260 [Planctomycetota bacterium]
MLTAGATILDGGDLEKAGMPLDIQGGLLTGEGTLNIQLIDGCDPTIGAGFEVMTYNSHSGVFATVNGLDIGGGRVLEVTYGPKSVVLTVVSEQVPGDFDDDGDVDLADFAAFAAAFTGPLP